MGRVGSKAERALPRLQGEKKPNDVFKGAATYVQGTKKDRGSGGMSSRPLSDFTQLGGLCSSQFGPWFPHLILLIGCKVE